MLLSISAASSGVALGITPGSLKLVLSSADRTKINRRPPTTGTAGEICIAKKGQLEQKKIHEYHQA